MITDTNTTNANKTAPTTMGSRSGEITSGVGEGVIEGVWVGGMKRVTSVGVGVCVSLGISVAVSIALGSGDVADSVTVGVYEGLMMI